MHTQYVKRFIKQLIKKQHTLKIFPVHQRGYL